MTMRYLPTSKTQQAGISIIELLISLVISVAVIAGAVQVVATGKRNFLDQDEVTFIQTNARYALDLISKDIRMAGYAGCATSTAMEIANSIDTDFGGYVAMDGLEGFEGEANTDSFPGDYKSLATTGTDSILIRRGDEDNSYDVKKHHPVAAELKLWQDHKFEKDTILMIADANCRHIGMFQVSGPNSIPANHLVHNTGTSHNCTKIIKGSFTCASPNCGTVKCNGYDKSTGTYGPGSRVMSFVAHAYFIGESTVLPGMPALMRQALNKSGAPTTATEEIAAGVEDLELLYGVDSNGDGAVDQLLKASEMDIDGSGSITSDDWAQVLSVKISLVFRSQNPVLPQAEARTLAGKDYNDRYMRQAVNSTVRIRNRG